MNLENLTIKDEPEENDVTPITGTTIRRPRPSASTLEFTSPSQKTPESTVTTQHNLVPNTLHSEPEQLDGQYDHEEVFYENENFQNGNQKNENEENEVWEEPEGLQMASNSFLIEVKFIFNF